MSPPIRAGRTPDGLVVSLHPIQSHAQVIDAWRRLAGEALVDNLFYEPDFAIGAGRAFGQGVSLLTVGVPSSGAVQENLLAAWPFRVVRRWGLPLPVLMGWTHPFSVFGAPLLLRDEPERALRGLLEASQALGLPRRLMMPFLPLDGPFAEVADSVLGAYGGRRADFWQHERGALDLAGRDRQARETYLHTQLSDRKERQLARLFRRLEASGAVIHETIRDPGALSAALEDYFALESRGWKGRLGTAIASRPDEADFLRAIIARYGRLDRVRIDRLRRNGASLASSIAIETGNMLWYLKIAHDEAEAKNSPGAQLLQRFTRSLLEHGTMALADSCAPPNFRLIETFWAERRRLAHGLIEAAGGDRFFPIATRLEGLRSDASKARARVVAMTAAKPAPRRSAATV